MGRGDSRTKRGKIFKASYGNARKHRVSTSKSVGKPAASTGTKKTSTAKKTK